jgi:hypothetical protein
MLFVAVHVLEIRLVWALHEDDMQVHEAFCISKNNHLRLTPELGDEKMGHDRPES